jgi:hypothetical protein
MSARGARTPPHYDEFTLFGWFYRWHSTTQTREATLKQIGSGEIWGKPSWRSGGVPIVQAHRGRLPAGLHGVEFLALIAPDKRYGNPEWRTDRFDLHGVPVVWHEHDAEHGDVVKLRVAITRIHPPIE